MNQKLVGIIESLNLWGWTVRDWGEMEEYCMNKNFKMLVKIVQNIQKNGKNTKFNKNTQKVIWQFIQKQWITTILYNMNKWGLCSIFGNNIEWITMVGIRQQCDSKEWIGVTIWWWGKGKNWLSYSSISASSLLFFGRPCSLAQVDTCSRATAAARLSAHVDRLIARCSRWWTWWCSWSGWLFCLLIAHVVGSSSAACRLSLLLRSWKTLKIKLC